MSENKECVVIEMTSTNNRIVEDGTCHTLMARMGAGGNQVHCILEQQVTCYDMDNERRVGLKGYKDQSPTLSARMGTGGNNVPMITQGINGDTAGTLDSNYFKGCGEREGMEREIVCVGNGQLAQAKLSENVGTLNCMHDQQAVMENLVVRRLTPLECERLQGYPTIRTVKCTEMTKDEYIAWNLAEEHIKVDAEKGIVYGMRGPGGLQLKEPRELKGTNIHGYSTINIKNGDTQMHCKAHRIIWIAVNGIIPEGYVIDHINNDKSDNRISNLQMLTPSENSTKARRDGLYKVQEDAGQAKITNEIHDLIQLLYETTNTTCVKLAEQFGISRSRVQQIIHDKPWMDIGEWTDSKGKSHKDADAPKYKAAGNSIALPFWQWLTDRIAKQLKKDGCDNPTMASLFDGISGFPLCATRSGIKPVWSSEIEEFPMAVAERHFGENGDLEKFL